MEIILFDIISTSPRGQWVNYVIIIELVWMSLWFESQGDDVSMETNTSIIVIIYFRRLSYWRCLPSCFNTLRPRQNRRYFADDIFKFIFLNENAWIALKSSLRFLLKVWIKNIPELVQMMAWRRPGDKPLSEPMMVSLLTYICVTRPQWVKPRFDVPDNTTPRSTQRKANEALSKPCHTFYISFKSGENDGISQVLAQMCLQMYTGIMWRVAAYVCSNRFKGSWMIHTRPPYRRVTRYKACCIYV